MTFHHVAITVNNLEESISFYKDFFGFEFVKEYAREDLGAEAVLLGLGGVHVELWYFVDMKVNEDALDNIRVRGIRHIAFAVADLGSVIAQFKEKGLEATEPKLGASGSNYSFVYDPNGVAVELYEVK